MNRFAETVVLSDLDGAVEFIDPTTGALTFVLHYFPINPNGLLLAPAGSIVSGPSGAYVSQGGTVWGLVPTTTSPSVSLLEVPFTFGSGTLVLKSLVPGDVVSPCYVRILTPWNLPGASIAVGTPSSPMALLAPGDANLYVPSRYDAGLDFKATVAEDLRLVVSGPSTLGSGYVVFTAS